MKVIELNSLDDVIASNVASSLYTSTTNLFMTK